MKTAFECMACYLRQTLQVARVSTDDPQLQLAALRKVSGLIAELDMERTPPENSVPIYKAIAAITACDDPYLEAKEQSNKQALGLLPECKEKIAAARDSLLMAVRFAIGGNIIDYGAMRSFDVDGAMKRCLHASFVVNHYQSFQQKLRELPLNANVLYLADNSGEIVYDSLVVSELDSMGFNVTVVVKSGPIINDALLADAKACGLEQMATVLENGTSCPGTPLASCSPELIEHFNGADLIISKGQGNFETLSEVKAEIFFLLTVKCSVVGAHLAEISNTPHENLPGDGELVLFHYNGKKNE